MARMPARLRLALQLKEVLTILPRLFLFFLFIVHVLYQDLFHANRWLQGLAFGIGVPGKVCYFYGG